jgi:hypothetical protein
LGSLSLKAAVVREAPEEPAALQLVRVEPRAPARLARAAVEEE